MLCAKYIERMPRLLIVYYPTEFRCPYTIVAVTSYNSYHRHVQPHRKPFICQIRLIQILKLLRMHPFHEPFLDEPLLYHLSDTPYLFDEDDHLILHSSCLS
jgi:hypothetical protein